MKVRYHFARQRRQLSYLAKRIIRLQAAGKEIAQDQLDRLRQKTAYLAERIGGREVRRVLGASIFLLAGTAAQAQTFAEPVSNPFGLVGTLGIYNYYNQPVLVDLDGDGDLDLFTSSYEVGDTTGVSSSNFIYFENIGTSTSPQYGPEQRNPFGIEPKLFSFNLNLVDLDRDGDFDLLVGGRDTTDYYLSPKETYYENVGSTTNPVFSSPVDPSFRTTPPARYNSLQILVFGDLDGDGDLDAIGETYDNTADDDGLRLLYYENVSSQGNITFRPPQNNPLGIEFEPYTLIGALVDIDEDGDLDLMGAKNVEIAYEEYEIRVVFFENTGSATNPVFGDGIDNPFMIAPVSDNDNQYLRQGFGDLDNDGDLDMLTISATDILYYENTTTVILREHASEIDLTAYPNPSTGLVMLQTQLTIASVEIFDALGKRVMLVTSRPNHIDLEQLPRGQYLLKINLPDRSYGLRRIQKQ